MRDNDASYNIRFGQLKVAGWGAFMFTLSLNINIGHPSVLKLPKCFSRLLIALFGPLLNRRIRPSTRYLWVKFPFDGSSHLSINWSMSSLSEGLRPVITCLNKSRHSWRDWNSYWYAPTAECKLPCSTCHVPVRVTYLLTSLAETKPFLTGLFPSFLTTVFALELRRSPMELISALRITDMTQSTSRGQRS